MNNKDKMSKRRSSSWPRQGKCRGLGGCGTLLPTGSNIYAYVVHLTYALSLSFPIYQNTHFNSELTPESNHFTECTERVGRGTDGGTSSGPFN